MSFEARFRSLCLSCEEWIQPGDQTTWGDGEVVHAHCPVLDISSAPACTTCWQIPAASGVCGCDE